MSFIFAETPGMYGAAADHEGLALRARDGRRGAGRRGRGGCSAAGRGSRKCRRPSIAEIQAYTADVAATLAAAAGLQGMYGASVASAGLGYDLTDAANAIPFTRIV